MTRPTQGNAGPGGRPLCFNGEPRREYVANDGYDAEGRLRTVTIPWAFSTECKSWASDPGTDPVPMAEGWKCHGCRHLSLELVSDAVTRRSAREARKAQESRA
jgi:hypothetical protein